MRVSGSVAAKTLSVRGSLVRLLYLPSLLYITTGEAGGRPPLEEEAVSGRTASTESYSSVG